MQQPIYWPASIDNTQDATTYQKAFQSQQLSSSQGGHPQQPLESIFDNPNRVADYTHYPMDAVQSCGSTPNMGASISFSGCLIENLNSLAQNNADGYGDGWNTTYAQSRTWSTSGGFPKVDLVAFGAHHPLGPLVESAALAMEIAVHKVIYGDTWAAGGPVYSKGFFPSEMSFSERMIPALVEAGIEWVIVSNAHISRACKGYPFSVHGDNTSPPNPADQQNPAQSKWWSASISVGCTPSQAPPFSFTPHRAQHIDPDTGNISTIVVIPADMAWSWMDGYECFGTTYQDELASYNNPEQPMLWMAAHDGDNAFAQGNTYYTQCVNEFVSAADAKGYNPSTVDQYLADHPVPESDIVHVEDGSWVNKAGDFGSPQEFGWNWPPTLANGTIDIENGWSLDERNYAIKLAAFNWVLTAAEMAGGVRASQVAEPGSDATAAEIAWHFMGPAWTSGYLYYGSSQDMPVKSTIASNQAHQWAAWAVGNGTAKGQKDETPPNAFTLQRYPWNPGAYGAGALWGYECVEHTTTDFWIWTFAYDLSGITKATLYVRKDADGVNPISSHVNELRHPPEENGEVGEWDTMPMVMRPVGFNPFNASIEDFVKPSVVGAQYTAKLTGFTSVLLDYYAEFVDTHGNTRKTDIYHVFVADGNVPCPS